MRLRWTADAAEDLREIHDFAFLDSPLAAHRIVNEIYAGILALKRMPHIGRPDGLRQTRDLIFPQIRYKVTYRVRQDGVEVLYIRHTSRGLMPQ